MMFLCSIGFDTWAKIGPQPSSLCPTWYGSEDVSMQGNLKNVETFAVNLLSAELRMRRCERHGLDVNSFEDDVNIVKSMIPLSQNFSDNLHKRKLHEPIRRLFSVLCIRMHWLTATFYVWWSQKTSEANNIDDAEVIAILHLQKAIDFIDQPISDAIEIIRTPHLESPGRRRGLHWRELSRKTPSYFLEELESSTVLSRSRHKFCEVCSE